MLALRDAPSPLPFSVGEFVAEVRLDIRGILVGVSLLSAEALRDEGGGGSFEDWWGNVPTLGDPAIVGRMFREFRSDVSDCFCMELAVCDVTRELVFGVLCVDDSDEFELVFMFARRCAVAGGSAETCMGGIATGSVFFG